MKRIIKNQEIRIDAHGHEKEVTDWSDTRYDIHLEKSFGKGTKQCIKVKISLNRDNVLYEPSDLSALPRNIKKELEDVFNNKSKRETFYSSLKKEMEKYPHGINIAENYKQALQRIGEVFGLEMKGDFLFYKSLAQKPTYTACFIELIDEQKYLCEMTINASRMTIKGIPLLECGKFKD